MEEEPSMSESTQTKSVADHFRQLYKRLAELEARVEAVEDRDDSSPSTDSPAKPDNEVLAQVIELQTRLKRVESENRELTDRCVRLQAHNEAISNLYVVKHRLHASFEPAEVMRIIREILSELVGASEFGIFLLDPRQAALRRVTGLGPESGPDSVTLGDGHLGRVAKDGQAFFYESSGNGERAPDVPLAAIPLRGETGPIGIIAIWRLLSHKDRLSPIDHQLLELVADHAPLAMMSAHLHQRSRSRSRSQGGSSAI